MRAAILLLIAIPALAQTPVTNWRGAGPAPCQGPDGGYRQCPPASGIVAIRAGRLFNSKSGKLETRQLILIEGDRIKEAGPESSLKIPAGSQVIDLRNQTVLPGLIDAHTHMFNQRSAKGTTEQYMLIAVENAHADLYAGFTSARDMSSHGNGYGDIAIRDAINAGRIDGPRYQVSTRGIVWGATPPNPAAPDNPLASTVVRNEEQARAAVRDQIAHGADWVKLFPGGAYSFEPDGKAQYVTNYPLPVLQALIDETHKLGKKAGCHVYGGEGQRNAIVAGCDTVEHAFGLDQEQANMMVANGLYYDPTLQRYTEPYMDDNDTKSTGGKYRMIAIFEHAVSMAAATPKLKIMVGSGVDGSTFVHGTQALELEALVKHGGFSASRALESATMINAEAMGWQDQLGSLEKGKYADIIAVPGDPLADITQLKKVNFVMKGGKVIRPPVEVR
jgi:imidazolonepropionase-like amidohydrolase